MENQEPSRGGSIQQPGSQRALEPMSSDPEPWSASVDGRQTPTYAEQDAYIRSLEGQLALDPSFVVPPSIAEPLAPAPSSPLVFRADTTAIRAELTAELPASALGLIPSSPPRIKPPGTVRPIRVQRKKKARGGEVGIFHLRNVLS